MKILLLNIFFATLIGFVLIHFMGVLIFAQAKNQTGLNDIQEMKLSLGKPIYTEIYNMPQYQNVNDDFASEFTFLGNGTLNGVEISAKGNGHAVPREDNTSSIIGRTFFTSVENGTASYDFKGIRKVIDNVTISTGATFFDANATGNLEFLKSVVGVYKSQLDERRSFAMWLLK
jgi:hypothetical protein